jgi:hypothetical protein
MGNDISLPNFKLRSSKDLDDRFNQISNYIIKELDAFFGPLEIGKLDDIIDDKESIKQERKVCRNLIGVYKRSLYGLMKDPETKRKLMELARNKGIDSKEFDVKVRTYDIPSMTILTGEDDERDKETKVSICDKVIDYYVLKYKIYRLLSVIDPYEKDYKYIEKYFYNNQNRLLDLDKRERQKVTKLIGDLKTSRDTLKVYLYENLKQILGDDLTYKELQDTYRKLTADSKLQSYYNKLEDACFNLNNFESNRPEDFKMATLSKATDVNLDKVVESSQCNDFKSGKRIPKAVTLTSDARQQLEKLQKDTFKNIVDMRKKYSNNATKEQKVLISNAYELLTDEITKLFADIDSNRVNIDNIKELNDSIQQLFIENENLIKELLKTSPQPKLIQTQ